VVTLGDHALASLRSVRLRTGAVFRVAGLDVPLRAGHTLGVRDQVILDVLAKQLGRRPIAFSVPYGRRSALDLDPFLVQQGLAFALSPGRLDSSRGAPRGAAGTRVDIERTELLVDQVFRYGRLFDTDTRAMDPAARQVASTLALPFIELGGAHLGRGNQTQGLDYLRRAYHLSPTLALAAALRRAETDAVE
jgi:hypothetical protein